METVSSNQPEVVVEKESSSYLERMVAGMRAFWDGLCYFLSNRCMKEYHEQAIKENGGVMGRIITADGNQYKTYSRKG